MAYEQTITIPQEKIQLRGSGLAVGGIVAALLGFGLALLVKAQNGSELYQTHFWHAYLLGFVFYLAITLGALFFVLLHHLARAGWSVLVRRIAEGLTGNFVLLAALFVPFIYLAVSGKLDILYHWAHPGITAHDKILAGKAPYLNLGFFFIRLIGFLVFWTALALFMRGTSIKQDQTGEARLSKRMEAVSAPGMLLFGFTLTFAAFDLLMSLNPHWFSTMWGVYYFATCALAFFSTLVLLTLALQKGGLLGALINTEHYHDLGKWMFAFTFFWGYIAFSQYMLIWYANLPEETQFYIPRQIGPWGVIGIVLIIVHLLIPFPGLLSRHVKRNTRVLAFWAVWSLLACLLDLFWIVMPNSFINQIPAQIGNSHELLQKALPKLVESNHGLTGPGIYSLAPQHGAFMQQVTFALYDSKAWLITAGVLVGMGGLYVAGTAFFLKRAALVPLKDPRLPESVAFENA